MQSQFRHLWRHAASPVSIITTSNGKELAGMTISSLTSVSMGPPHMLVSFNCQIPSRTSEILKARRQLVLNMLSATTPSILLAKAFAGRVASGHNTNPFLQFPEMFIHSEESNAIPMIKNASARMLCDVQNIYPVQDHEIIVASVNRMWINESTPLLYREHKFWEIGDEVK